MELSVREPRPMLDCLLTVAGLLALGASTSAVFLRRRALWRCSRARQLRLSPSKDVRSWKRPHCWQKRCRFPSRMMLLTCKRTSTLSGTKAAAYKTALPELRWLVASMCML